jgi:hypothetical protein
MHHARSGALTTTVMSHQVPTQSLLRLVAAVHVGIEVGRKSRRMASQSSRAPTSSCSISTTPFLIAAAGQSVTTTCNCRDATIFSWMRTRPRNETCLGPLQILLQNPKEMGSDGFCSKIGEFLSRKKIFMTMYSSISKFRPVFYYYSAKGFRKSELFFSQPVYNIWYKIPTKVD